MFDLGPSRARGRMKKGRGSHVPTPSTLPSRAAGVKGVRATASLDAGEHDGTHAHQRRLRLNVPAPPLDAHLVDGDDHAAVIREILLVCWPSGGDGGLVLPRRR